MVANSNGKDGFKELRFKYDSEEVIKKKWELQLSLKLYALYIVYVLWYCKYFYKLKQMKRWINSYSKKGIGVISSKEPP